MLRLAVVWHSRTGLAEAMAGEIQRGARAAAVAMGRPALRVDAVPCAAAVSDDLLAAGGVVLVAPENLGGLTGATIGYI